MRFHLIPPTIFAITGLLLAQPACLGSAGSGESSLKGASLPAAGLRFIANDGQYETEALLLVNGSGGRSLFSRTGMDIQLLPDGRERGRPATISLSFADPSPDVVLEPLGELSGKYHFLSGSNPASWKRNVRSYSAAAYRQVWPGIDVVFGTSGKHLKYDVIVAAGADPQQIGFNYSGVEDVGLSEDGRLRIRWSGGEFFDDAPVAFQDTPSGRVAVDASFRIESGIVRFSIGAYDRALPLVIDPVTDLQWSTFLGGTTSFDEAHSVAHGDDGTIYVSGETYSTDFPATSGSYDEEYDAQSDAFVARFTPDGRDLIYATYIGGSFDDSAWDVVADATGNAYVGGYTDSPDFPGTAGSYEPDHQGGTDGFILKLTPDGSTLSWSTFLGGEDGEDWVFGIAIDPDNNIYATGQTESGDFPTTPGAYDTSYNGSFDAFAAKVSASGSQLLLSTFLGAGNTDWGQKIGIDGSRAMYITGHTMSNLFPVKGAVPGLLFSGGFDVFVTKLAPAGNDVVYSTFLGGSANDYGRAIAVTNAGEAYIAGSTESPTFNTSPSAYQASNSGKADAFAVKLALDGSLAYGTLLGGEEEDSAYGAALEEDTGRLILTGQTFSEDFPISDNPYDSSFNGNSDVFVSKLGAGGDELLYSTLIGGESFESCRGATANGAGEVWTTGVTISSDFPATPLAYMAEHQGAADAFVLKVRTSTGTLDETPPSKPVVTDDGAYTTDLTSLHAEWSSADPESGIAEYMYAVGDQPTDTGSYLVGWMSAGTSKNVTLEAISLEAGKVYYWYVKALNGAGLWSTVGISNGIMAIAEQFDNPAAVKLLPDATAVVLRDVVVTATPSQLAGRIYTQSRTAASGIAIAGNASAAEGDIIEVGGILSTLEGERIIWATSVEGVSVTDHQDPLDPFVMRLRFVAGGDFFFVPGSGAGQRAPTDPTGRGLSTTGLLITTTGQIQDINGEHVFIDDGSWHAPAEVRVARTYIPSGASVGSYIKVTGISTLRSQDEQFSLVIRPRRPDDVVIVTAP